MLVPSSSLYGLNQVSGSCNAAETKGKNKAVAADTLAVCESSGGSYVWAFYGTKTLTPAPLNCSAFLKIEHRLQQRGGDAERSRGILFFWYSLPKRLS